MGYNSFLFIYTYWLQRYETLFVFYVGVKLICDFHNGEIQHGRSNIISSSAWETLNFDNVIGVSFPHWECGRIYDCLVNQAYIK